MHTHAVDGAAGTTIWFAFLQTVSDREDRFLVLTKYLTKTWILMGIKTPVLNKPDLHAVNVAGAPQDCFFYWAWKHDPIKTCKWTLQKFCCGTSQTIPERWTVLPRKLLDNNYLCVYFQEKSLLSYLILESCLTPAVCISKKANYYNNQTDKLTNAFKKKIISRMIFVITLVFEKIIPQSAQKNVLLWRRTWLPLKQRHRN